MSKSDLRNSFLLRLTLKSYILFLGCLAYEREFFKASFQNAATGAKGESTPSSPWLADNVDSQRNLLESGTVCTNSQKQFY